MTKKFSAYAIFFAIIFCNFGTVQATPTTAEISPVEVTQLSRDSWRGHRPPPRHEPPPRHFNPPPRGHFDPPSRGGNFAPPPPRGGHGHFGPPPPPHHGPDPRR